MRTSSSNRMYQMVHQLEFRPQALLPGHPLPARLAVRAAEILLPFGLREVAPRLEARGRAPVSGIEVPHHRDPLGTRSQLALGRQREPVAAQRRDGGIYSERRAHRRAVLYIEDTRAPVEG